MKTRTTKTRRKIGRIEQAIKDLRNSKKDLDKTSFYMKLKLKGFSRENIRSMDFKEFLNLPDLFNNNGELDFISKALAEFQIVNQFLNHLNGKEMKADNFEELKLGENFHLLIRLVDCLKECRLLHNSKMSYSNTVYLEKTALDAYSRDSQIP